MYVYILCLAVELAWEGLVPRGYVVCFNIVEAKKYQNKQEHFLSTLFIDQFFFYVLFKFQYNKHLRGFWYSFMKFSLGLQTAIH